MVLTELTISPLSSILYDFQQFTNKPEVFVSIKENFCDDIKQFLKQTYDITKIEEEKSCISNALPELIIHNFDDEQIFQQIELQNDSLLNRSISKVSKLTVAKERLIFTELDNDSQNEHSETSEDADSEKNINESGDEMMEQDSNNEENIDDVESEEAYDDNDDEFDDVKIKNKVKSSSVDDKFFKLNEMNEFLLSQEKESSRKKETSKSDSESESDDVDMFQASEDEADENDFEGNDKLKNPRYKDFFGKRNAQTEINEFISNIDDKEYMNTVKSSLELREKEPKKKIEDIEDTVVKSSLELREARLKKKIEDIEDAAISEKPWQLKGEVTAENRPLNSLLEEVLEFDLTSRPAPVITEETTYILEDVIKQRIKDKVFDDVQRKQKPVDTPLEFKKKLILDQEKSKESLAQIYEKEYIKQREALNTDQSAKDEVEPKLHQEIKSIMLSLFNKLDGLSNFHFTPKPIAPELRIVNNLPAISMEEVAPVAFSDAALLAPEEVAHKLSGDTVGKSERTKTDKNRERRKKKQKQKIHAQEKLKKEKTINKLRPGLGNKYSKEKAKKMLDIVTKDANVDKMNHLYDKKIKSSTAFFSQLQENVTSQIKLQTKSKNSNKHTKQIDVKRLKL